MSHSWCTLPAVATEQTFAPPVTFRRATRDDAITLAHAKFLAGERIEMQTLADELGVARTTLYRWVGEREQLLDEVFGRLIDAWLIVVIQASRGDGLERVLDVIRRYLEHAAAAEPLIRFTATEPALALRILMNRKGIVAERSQTALQDQLEAWAPELQIDAAIINVIHLTSVTLVWGPLATGQQPDIDSAMLVARTLLSAGDPA